MMHERTPPARQSLAAQPIKMAKWLAILTILRRFGEPFVAFQSFKDPAHPEATADNGGN